MISAPSGAGKSTIIHAVRKRFGDLGYSVSHTSRRPRSTERDGVDYFFVNEPSFRKMIEEGAFVEWARVYDAFYGTTYSGLEKQTQSGLDVLLDVDSQGARNIKARFESSLLIYVLPPSLRVLEERLRNRGTDEESTIRMRMERTAREIENCAWYDYIVINDDLETAVLEVQSIIMSQRCRVSRRLPRIEERFNLSLHQH